MTATDPDLLDHIAAMRLDPGCTTTRLVLADRLEEMGDEDRADGYNEATRTSASTPAGSDHNHPLVRSGQVMATSHSTVEYRDIPGYPGYRVGNDGSVWSSLKVFYLRAGDFAGMVSQPSDSWKRLKPSYRGQFKYGTVALHRGERQRTERLHSLVLLAFVGPRPSGYHCRHLDGNPSNNILANLTWGTVTENQRDRARHGTVSRGEKNGHAVLSDAQVAAILPRLDVGESRAAVARELGVSRYVISHIANGKTYRHLRPADWKPTRLRGKS